MAVVVISGASSGIGRELAELYRQRGDTVIGLSRRALGENDIVCDVTDLQSITAAVEQIKSRYEKVDVLINNAGVGASGATELLDWESAEMVMNTNYRGLYFLTRRVLALMERGGRIINISSACAFFPLPFRAVYCASKAAVNMLSHGLRMELKDAGIRVVAVCPGDIKSEFTENRVKDATTSARYADAPERAKNKVDGRNDKRMDVKKASKKIFKICVRKNGAVYIIGAKYKVFRFFQRILPESMFVAIIGKLFG